jgi:CBS domain-containing protein
MSDRKVVQDIMLEIFEYPHVPYGFTIDQIIKVIKASFIQSKKITDPLAVLVFDDKYNLLGTVTPKDILKGIVLSLTNQPKKVKPSEKVESEFFIDLESFFCKEFKNLAQKPVCEIMVPAKHFVDPSDPVTKAAYLMIQFNLAILLVIKDKKKLVGVVRMFEVFDVITEKIGRP